MQKDIIKKQKLIDKKQNEISELNIEIQAIQKNCPHSNASKNFRSDTGNYDPTKDRRWIEFTCLDCNFKWEKDQ